MDAGRRAAVPARGLETASHAPPEILGMRKISFASSTA